MTEQSSAIARIEAKMDEETKRSCDKVWHALNKEMKGIVKEVESHIMTTQNHYGDYMSVLHELKEADIPKSTAVYLLLRASGNEQGILNAARFS